MPLPRQVDHTALADAIRSRRSIDLFEPGSVDDALLREAIEVARWAPNHRLTQPWRFYLIGPATRRAIAELVGNVETRAKGERVGAVKRERVLAIPGMFVLTTRRSADELQDREDYAACCCAAQNLMLYLWQRGVGVKWTTGAVTREPAFYELLGSDPERERVVGLYWYGLPKVVPTQKRRDPAEIIVERP
jgi:nitroreductase